MQVPSKLKPMNRLLASLALLMVCSGVAAAPVRVSCSEGHCEEFDIVEKKSIRTGTDGTLVWARMRAWKQGCSFFARREGGDRVCFLDAPSGVDLHRERADSRGDARAAIGLGVR